MRDHPPERSGEETDAAWCVSRTDSLAELLPVLLARWESRAHFYDALEAEARRWLDGLLAADELEMLIEQQIATEQTEYIIEFFWTLHATGCQAPARMAAWIERHNRLVAELRERLHVGDRKTACLGPQHKRKLWRLQTACFSDRAKSACCARLDDRHLVLSLKDLERFMALHMDATLCRDRLDALVRIRLLRDERQPNLRLFRPTERLLTIVSAQLDMLRRSLLGLPDGSAA